MATDPLTLVYEGIVATLAASPSFAQLVPVGNRIVFTGTNRDPIKHAVSDRDFPEVRLIQVGGNEGPYQDTSGKSFTQRYQLQVSTGDQRVDYRLNPVTWAAYRALSGLQADLASLTWGSYGKVLTTTIGTVDQGTSEADLKRGIEGWAAMLTIEVVMWFAHADLSEEE